MELYQEKWFKIAVLNYLYRGGISLIEGDNDEVTQK